MDLNKLFFRPLKLKSLNFSLIILNFPLNSPPVPQVTRLRIKKTFSIHKTKIPRTFLLIPQPRLVHKPSIFSDFPSITGHSSCRISSDMKQMKVSQNSHEMRNSINSVQKVAVFLCLFSLFFNWKTFFFPSFNFQAHTARTNSISLL